MDDRRALLRTEFGLFREETREIKPATALFLIRPCVYLSLFLVGLVVSASNGCRLPLLPLCVNERVRPGAFDRAESQIGIGSALQPIFGLG